MKVQICLVSQQPIPNLLPLKSKELKPDLIVLLTTKQMEQIAKRITPIIESWNIKVIHKSIDAYDLQTIKSVSLDVLNTYQSDEIFVNITGGTKIMSIGAYEVFNMMGKPTFYVDTFDNQIIQLKPNSKIPFEHWIDVGTYLRSYGQILKNDKNEFFDKYMTVLNNLFNELIQLDSQKYFGAFSTLNYYTSLMKEDTTKFPIEKQLETKHLNYKELIHLISFFDKYKLLDFQSNKLSIPNKELLEFISGGWLEAYIYSIVKSIDGTDVRCSLTVESALNPNEYDIVFTYNNKLFIIECKTANYKDSEKGSNIIYKLSTLKDFAGGLFGKGMLVSYQNLTESMKKRLNLYKLDFTTDLKNIRQKIVNWITK